MNIELMDLTVRDLVADYDDVGYVGIAIEESCRLLHIECNREKSAN